MSVIRDNLLKIHLAKNVAGLMIEHHDETIRSLAKRLITECDAAHRAIEWHSIKINLNTCNRIMRTYSQNAYGNPDKNEVDILQLMGLAITQLEDAMMSQQNSVKRIAIELALNTMLELNERFDSDLKETEAYIAASIDANILETALEA